MPVLLGEELLGEGQVEPLDDLSPELPLLAVAERRRNPRVMAAHDAVGVGVDGRDVGPGEPVLVVVEEKAEIVPQAGGEGVGVRGQQDPAVVRAGALHGAARRPSCLYPALR